MSAGPVTSQNERMLVLLLCLLGAVHVLLFAAAFPFFSVVDEQVHFDLAVRYSHGEIPRKLTDRRDKFGRVQARAGASRYKGDE